MKDQKYDQDPDAGDPKPNEKKDPDPKKSFRIHNAEADIVLYVVAARIFHNYCETNRYLDRSCNYGSSMKGAQV